MLQYSRKVMPRRDKYVNNTAHKKIYKTVLEALEKTKLSHNELTGEVLNRLYSGISGGGEVGE